MMQTGGHLSSPIDSGIFYQLHRMTDQLVSPLTHLIEQPEPQIRNTQPEHWSDN